MCLNRRKSKAKFKLARTFATVVFNLKYISALPHFSRAQAHVWSSEHNYTFQQNVSQTFRGYFSTRLRSSFQSNDNALKRPILHSREDVCCTGNQQILWGFVWWWWWRPLPLQFILSSLFKLSFVSRSGGFWVCVRFLLLSRQRVTLRLFAFAKCFF